MRECRPTTQSGVVPPVDTHVDLDASIRIDLQAGALNNRIDHVTAVKHASVEEAVGRDVRMTLCKQTEHNNNRGLRRHARKLLWEKDLLH